MIVFYWLTFYMSISYVTTTSLPLFVCITKKDHHFSNETTAELTYDCKGFQKVTAVTSMNGDNTKDSTPIFTVLWGNIKLIALSLFLLHCLSGVFHSAIRNDDLTISSTMMMGMT